MYVLFLISLLLPPGSAPTIRPHLHLIPALSIWTKSRFIDRSGACFIHYASLYYQFQARWIWSGADRVMKMPLDIGGRKDVTIVCRMTLRSRAHAEILQPKQMKKQKKRQIYGLGSVISCEVVIWGNVVVDPHLPKRQLADRSHASPRAYNQVKEKSKFSG